MNHVTVIGAGSWGTALAASLAWRGMEVQFWGRDADLMREIASTRCNSRYLPGLALPEKVSVIADPATLKPADMLFFVVPSKGMREAAQLIASTPAATTPLLVSCAKGIEMDSGLRMSQIIAQALPHSTLAVLTGPNHAEEVAAQLATAAVVACEDDEAAKKVQHALTLPFFRTYTTSDVIGAEWGGALKNPYAIAAGIARGMKLGDNAIAALVTRALAEMVRFGVRMGGRAETFQGLSGVGDLIATCYSEHSRNHRVGLQLGQGRTLEEILTSTRMIAEGVPNTASLHQAARAHDVRTPLLDEIHAVLHAGKPPQAGMKALLSRDPRPEMDV